MTIDVPIWLAILWISIWVLSMANQRNRERKLTYLGAALEEAIARR